MACCDPAAAADLPLKARPPAPADAGQFWVEMEYLAWSVKGDRLPPLVTTSPAGTPQAQAGILGPPSTTVLFGDSSVNGGWRSGRATERRILVRPSAQIRHRSELLRPRTGVDRIQCKLGRHSDSGAAIPRRQYRSAKCNADRFSRPAIRLGNRKRSLSPLRGRGALPPRHRLLRHAMGRRALQSAGRLSVSARVRPIGHRQSVHLLGRGAIPPGTVFAANDSFHARSNFHGLDLGGAGAFLRGPWMLEWRAKVALGANFNESQINGASSITAGGVATSSPGGLLALSSNIGSYTQTRFAAVPDFAVKAGYRFARDGKSLRATRCSIGRAFRGPAA